MQSIWFEKYRPITIKDCVLPKTVKEIINGIVASGSIPNMLFCGKAGTGKTSVAIALCKDLGVDYRMINASKDSGIDTLRNEIEAFASTKSMSRSGRKIMVLDEADHLNKQSTQPALRGFIEKHAMNCGFIFTANWPERLIEPLHSRCSILNFSIPAEERADVAKEFMKRAAYILKQENVTFEPKAVAFLVQQHFPDYRRILNEMETFSKINGSITEGILAQNSSVNMIELHKIFKKKNYTSLRDWVEKNIDNDVTYLFRKMYDELYQFVEPTSVPYFINSVADWLDKSTRSTDQEITFMGFMNDILVNCEFVKV